MTATPERIVVPREDEDDAWVQLRPKKQRFSGGERREIYRFLDEIQTGGMGQVLMQYELLRHVSAHLIHSWSIDLPVPRVLIDKGKVIGYEDLDSLDALDDDVETFVLQYANEWAQKIALRFGPDPDPASPTKPSDDSKPVSEASAA